MPTHHAPTGTASTTDAPDGLIAGHLLRLIREQIGLTQEAAADALDVDLNTWRSWETGRRSLIKTTVRQLRAITRRLRTLGAEPVLLDNLEVAIEADVFLAHVLIEARRGRPADHMLAGWVYTRTWNDLLAWTLAGTPPKALNGLIVPSHRRGPTPARPELAPAVRTAFFDSLRTTAERAGGDPAATLLRRQVYFMAAWDDSPAGRDWLTKAERIELRSLRQRDGWTPGWVAGRSLAVARACQGDREQLRHFIDTQMVDDSAEAANLNYWSYWVGENPAAATTDLFMTGDLGQWRGTVLLRHLVDGLHTATPYLELSIHTVWALLGRRPFLLADDPTLTARLAERVATLLDTGTGLSPAARRELDQIRFLTVVKGPR